MDHSKRDSKTSIIGTLTLGLRSKFKPNRVGNLERGQVAQSLCVSNADLELNTGEREKEILKTFRNSSIMLLIQLSTSWSTGANKLKPLTRAIVPQSLTKH